jgi:hypothetical protein
VSVNKYKPHIWVIPEDDANNQLVNGFLLHYSVNVRAIGIDPPAGGWGRVLDLFEQKFVPYLRQWSLSHVVMLMDFDDTDDRKTICEKRIPDDLKQRVFVPGTKDNPEALKRELNVGFESIGEGLAGDCLREDCGQWNNTHLVHNRDELLRMSEVMKPIIFF